jgi:hypothetical protein
MPVCDTVTVDDGGGGGDPGEDESTLEIKSLDVTIGDSPTTVEANALVSNEITSGDGKYYPADVTFEAPFGSKTIQTDIGAGTAGNIGQTFTDVPDGEYTVTATVDWENGQVQATDDIVIDSGGGGGGDNSTIDVENLAVENPSDGTVVATFDLANVTQSGSGETLSTNYTISIDGDTVQTGVETAISPGEAVELSYEFTNVNSGDRTVSVSTDYDSKSTTVNVSGGGGGGGDDPSPIEDIPNTALIGGAALGVLLLSQSGGGGGRRRPRRRRRRE